MKWILSIILMALLVVLSSQAFAVATGSMTVSCSVNDTSISCGQTARISCSITFNDPFCAITTSCGVDYVDMWINSNQVRVRSPATGNRTVGVWNYDVTASIATPTLYYMFDYVTVVPVKVGQTYTGYSTPIVSCGNKDAANPGDYNTQPGCNIDFTPDEKIELYGACSCSSPTKNTGTCLPDTDSLTGGSRTISFTMPDPSCTQVPSYQEPCTICDTDILPRYGFCSNGLYMTREWYAADEDCCARLGDACYIPDPDPAIPCSYDQFTYTNENNQKGVRTTIDLPARSDDNEPTFKYSDYTNFTSVFRSPEGYQPVIREFIGDGAMDIILVNNTKNAITVLRYYNGNFSVETSLIVQEGGTIVGNMGYKGMTLLAPMINSTGNSKICEYDFSTVAPYIAYGSCVDLVGTVMNSSVYCYQSGDHACYFKTRSGTTHTANKITYSGETMVVSKMNLTVNASGALEIGWAEDNWNMPIVTNFYQIGDVNEVVWTVPVNSAGTRRYIPIVTSTSFTRDETYVYPPTFAYTNAPTNIIGYPIAKQSGTAFKGYWVVTSNEGGVNKVYRLDVRAPGYTEQSETVTITTGNNFAQVLPTGLALQDVVCASPVSCYITTQGEVTALGPAYSKQYFYNGEGISSINFSTFGAINNPPIYGDPDVFIAGEVAGVYYGYYYNTSDTSKSGYFFYNPSSSSYTIVNSVRPPADIFPKATASATQNFVESPMIVCGTDANGMDTSCFMTNSTNIYLSQYIFKITNFNPSTLQYIGSWSEIHGITYDKGELFVLSRDTTAYPYNYRDHVDWFNRTKGSFQNVYMEGYKDCRDYMYYNGLTSSGTKWMFSKYSMSRVAGFCATGSAWIQFGDADKHTSYSTPSMKPGYLLASEAKWVGDYVYAGYSEMRNYSNNYAWNVGAARLDINHLLESADCRASVDPSCYVTKLSSNQFYTLSVDENGAGCGTDTSANLYCSAGGAQVSTQWNTYQNSKSLGRMPTAYAGKINSTYTKVEKSFISSSFEPMVYNFDNSGDGSKEIMYWTPSQLVARETATVNYAVKATYTGYDQISQAAVCDVDMDGSKEYLAVFRTSSAPYTFTLRALNFDGGEITEKATYTLTSSLGSELGNIICDNLDSSPYDMEVAFKDSKGYFYILKYSGGFSELYGATQLQAGPIYSRVHSVTDENLYIFDNDIVLLDNWEGYKALAFLQQEDDDSFRLWVYKIGATTDAVDTYPGAVGGETLDPALHIDQRDHTFIRRAHIVGYNSSLIIVALSSVAGAYNGDFQSTSSDPESRLIVFKQGSPGSAPTVMMNDRMRPDETQINYAGQYRNANVLLYPFVMNYGSYRYFGVIREFLNPKGAPDASTIDGHILKADVQIYDPATWSVINSGSFPSYPAAVMPSASNLPIVFDKNSDGNDEIFWAGRSESYTDNVANFISIGGSGSVVFSPMALPSGTNIPILADINNDEGLDFVYYGMPTTRVYTAAALLSSVAQTMNVGSTYLSSTGTATNPVEGTYSNNKVIAVQVFAGDNSYSKLKLLTFELGSVKDVLTYSGTTIDKYLYGFDVNGDGNTEYVTPYGLVSPLSGVLSAFSSTSTNSLIIPVNLDADGFVDMFYTGPADEGAIMSNPDAEYESLIGSPEITPVCDVTNSIIQVSARYKALSLSGVQFKMALGDSATYQNINYKKEGLVLIFDPINLMVAGSVVVHVQMVNAQGTVLASGSCTAVVSEASIPTKNRCSYVEDFFAGDDPRVHGWEYYGTSPTKGSGYFGFSVNSDTVYEYKLQRTLDCPTSDLTVEIGYELSDDADATFGLDAFAESNGVGMNYAIGYLRMDGTDVVSTGDGSTKTKVSLVESDIGYNWDASTKYRIKMTFDTASQKWSAWRSTDFSAGSTDDMEWSNEDQLFSNKAWVMTFLGKPDYTNVENFDRFRINLKSGTIKLYFIKIYGKNYLGGTPVILEEHAGMGLLRTCNITGWCGSWGEGALVESGMSSVLGAPNYCSEKDLRSLAKAIPTQYSGGCFSELLSYCVRYYYPITHRVFDEATVESSAVKGGRFDFINETGISQDAITSCSMMLTFTEGTSKVVWPSLKGIWNILWENKLVVLVLVMMLILVIPVISKLKK